ncbi:MAG: GerMN domain-containing protein, partial [Sphaerochaetaceae bacterium]
TVSQQIAYIDFTREFTYETVWGQSGKDAAIEQVRRTMRSFTGIRDIVILVEGKPLQSNVQ